jgi:hypothetical protein
MRCPINLNQQARRKAREVRNIAADRVLTTKFETLWSRPERAPQQDLRQAHLSPQRSCTLDVRA